MNKGKEEKNAEISARITQIIEYLGETPNSFATKLGYSRAQTIYDIQKMKSAPSFDFFQRFSNAGYSVIIDIDWLLTGKGNMLRSENNRDVPMANSQTVDEPVINRDYQGAPYYNVDFIGGFDIIANDQTRIPDYYINYQPYNKNGVLWCNITGHSMEPQINHGDVIAIRECTLNDIQYGEIYAIVLDTIRTVKILRKSNDPKKLRFIPINTTDFDEQEFEMSRIIKVFEVLGSISRFF